MLHTAIRDSQLKKTIRTKYLTDTDHKYYRKIKTKHIKQANTNHILRYKSHKPKYQATIKKDTDHKIKTTT